MGDNKYQIMGNSSSAEKDKREQFLQLLKQSPIPENEFLMNLGLFLNRQLLSRIIFMHELYKKIINVHGVVMEFGVRWGQNLALFEVFRGMYEPYNYNRKIIGFDTFAGFPTVNKKDGNLARVGDYSVEENYVEYLKKILSYHESENPISHISKSVIVPGDATITINDYLANHPETIIAFAYFDFDIYEPTKVCLEAIKDRLTKGSIVAFDELNHHGFPGETIAVQEVLGLDRYKIQRSPLNPYISYIVIE